MRRVLLPVLGVLAAVLAVATLAQADFAMHLQGPQPTVEALYAEGGTVYVARLDGRVQALDRASESVLWTRDLSPARALDLVSEPGGPLYVATSIDANGASEPIVAIDKATGNVQWRSTTAYAAAGIQHFLGGLGRDAEAKADAYRLALDTGDASPYLWAGLEHGYVVMMHKATGAPVLQVDGTPRVLVPTSPDRLTPIAGNPCLRPSGIYALQVHDGQLWAARNFGGVDKQGKCANPLLTSLFNVLYRLDANVLVDAAGRPAGNDTMQFPNNLRADPIDPAGCTLQCPNGRRFAIPSIFDLWVDPWQSNETVQTLYAVGAFTGNTGVLMGLRAGGDPAPNAPFPTAFALSDTYADDDSEFGAPPPVALATADFGPGSTMNTVRGDATHVYVATWQNRTQGMTNVPPGGFVIKYPKAGGLPVDWVYATAEGGGDVNAVSGRSWEAGDVNALAVEPGPDGRVIVGHGNAVPPFPGPGIAHQGGALVLETPKDKAPVPVLMMPAARDILAGSAPVAFRVDYPRDDGSSLLAAELHYSIGPDGPWTRLANLNIAQEPGNRYTLVNNVPLDLAPERDDLRIRLTVRGQGGEAGTDRTDLGTAGPGGLVTVDRTAPAVSAFGVASPDAEVRHQAQGNPVISVDRPTFFVRGNDTCPLPAPACGASDIDPSRSFLWIDDPTKAYPFLQFQEEAGYFRGFRFDMAQPHPYGALPSRLADGPHVVHAELVDFAGNFDFERWTVVVDTGVEAPRVSPLHDTWVDDARPSWTAQFNEDVEVVSVRVDGAALSPGQYQVYPRHPTQNPDGTRIVARPTADRPDGSAVRFEATVRDRAGNLAGPFASTINVDRGAPLLLQPTPLPDGLLPEGRPTLSLQVTDARSGVAVQSLRMWLDGQLQPARFESDRLVFQPVSLLATGSHEVRAEAQDLAGNTATLAWSFSIDTQAPAVAVRAVLPDGKDAARRGDVVRLEALVTGTASAVAFDARALDPAAKSVAGVLQGPGRFVADITVVEARTGDLQVVATATDAAGHKGTAQAFVPIDNRPPVSFMLELPAKVAHSFLVQWAQDGDRDAKRFILEAQVDDGAWQVVDSTLTGTSYLYKPAAGPAVLRFRVSAVDGAGNQQSAPSNVVETLLSATPVDAVLLPPTWPTNGTVAVTVTPLPTAKVVAVTANLTLPDGRVLTQQLGLAGTVFRGEWNVTVAPGTGRIDFDLRDASGTVVRLSYPASFQDPVPLGVRQGSAEAEDAPLPAFAVLAVPLVAAAALLRRSRERL